MTVRELMSRLAALNPDLPIYLVDEQTGDRAATNIKIEDGYARGVIEKPKRAVLI